MPNKKADVIIFLSCFYIAYAYLSINMILPAMPGLATVFHTSTASVKLSVTMLLLGYSIAQPLWGILSDRYGRRIIILSAIFIAIIGSICSAIAHSILFFAVARLIEGVGSGFGPSLSRIISRDLLDKKDLHICMTYLVAVAALMPSISPIIGGQVMHLLGWRSILYGLILAGIFIYLITYRTLPETISQKSELSAKKILNDIIMTLSNRHYIGYFLIYSFSLSGLITFYIIAPYIFISHLHIHPARYGLLLLVVGASYMLSCTFNRILIHRLGTHHLILVGTLPALFASIVLLLLYCFGQISVLSVLLPACLFAISCGFISPTANAAAMSSIKGDLGVPASLLGFGAMMLSTLASAILAHFADNNLLPLLLIFSTVTLLGLFSYYLLIIRPSQHG